MLAVLTGRLGRARSLDAANDAIAGFSERSPLPTPPSFIHPRLVWIPVVVWGSAKVFDLVDDRPAARAMVATGVLAAIPTMITGHQDWMQADAPLRRAASVHAALNNLVVALYAASWLVRGRDHPKAGVVLSWTGGSLLVGAVALGVQMNRDLSQATDPAVASAP